MFNVFDEVSRYAADDGIWRDVPVHDGTGCDDGITADSDTSHYGRIGPIQMPSSRTIRPGMSSLRLSGSG